MKCNIKLCPYYFSVNVSVLAVVFRQQFLRNNSFRQNCRRNTRASTKTFTEKQLGHNFALHFTTYLSIALSKILPHSKTIKSAKKLLLFGKNDCCRLSNFSRTHTFLNFDHISGTYNQINCMNIWFAKVIIILIMAAQVLFFDVFSEKDPHLNVVE